MQSEGEQLKYAIRGKGMTIEDAALKLGMSRQQFGYHLQKARLGRDIKQKAKDILGIDIDDPVEAANDPGIEYSVPDSKQNYSQDQLIIYMGEILKLSIEELQESFINEVNRDKRRVIKEVIQTKEKLALLEERLKDKDQIIRSKDELIEQLKQNIKIIQ
jgi:hypothetical protein